MGLLDGQRAFITGGGSGIGRATAARMTEEGARVAVVIDGGLTLHGSGVDGALDRVDELMRGSGPTA